MFEEGRDGPAMRLRLSLFGELGGGDVDGWRAEIDAWASSASRLRLARRWGGRPGPIPDILLFL
jgi:hypothetical protein